MLCLWAYMQRVDGVWQGETCLLYGHLYFAHTLEATVAPRRAWAPQGDRDCSLNCKTTEPLSHSHLPSPPHWAALTGALRTSGQGLPVTAKAPWLKQTTSYPVLLSGWHTEVTRLQVTEWSTPTITGETSSCYANSFFTSKYHSQSTLSIYIWH